MIDQKTYQRIKMVNCARCQCELIGESMTSWYLRLSQEIRDTLPPLMAGRLNDRPYCRPCALRPQKEDAA